jgi:hypothetical protein
LTCLLRIARVRVRVRGLSNPEPELRLLVVPPCPGWWGEGLAGGHDMNHVQVDMVRLLQSEEDRGRHIGSRELLPH